MVMGYLSILCMVKCIYGKKSKASINVENKIKNFNFESIVNRELMKLYRTSFRYTYRDLFTVNKAPVRPTRKQQRKNEASPLAAGQFESETALSCLKSLLNLQNNISNLLLISYVHGPGQREIQNLAAFSETRHRLSHSQ